MNYFELYDIPVSFKVDKKALKKKFYELSRKFHPDFYTLEGEAKQAEILELSSLNNEAYKVLKDFNKRMKYVLDLKKIIAEEGKNKIPQAFLMEMMDTLRLWLLAERQIITTRGTIHKQRLSPIIFQLECKLSRLQMPTIVLFQIQLS